MRARRTAVLATLLALAVPATAAAAPERRTADWWLELKARQTTTWQATSQFVDGCDNSTVTMQGRGEQVLDVRTTEPQRLQATWVRDRASGLSMVELRRRGRRAARAPFPVWVRARRTNAIEDQREGGGESGCGGAVDPAGPAAAEDCGTKTATGRAGLSLVTPAEYPSAPRPRRSVLLVHAPYRDTAGTVALADALFTNCPFAGTTSELLATPDAFATPLRLTRRRGPITLRGRHTETTEMEGFVTRTTVTWTVRLTEDLDLDNLLAPLP